MQPYQQSALQSEKESEKYKNYLSKVGNLLSYYIPANIAVKGINKVQPLLKSFTDSAQQKGFSDEEIRDFIKEKYDESKESQKNQPKSVFDELLGDVDINQLPEQVQNQLGFLKTISDQLEKKGTPRESSTFKRLKKKIDEVLSGKIGELQGEAMAMPQQPMQSQQQLGQGSQALMAILQKIQATRGG